MKDHVSLPAAIETSGYAVCSGIFSESDTAGLCKTLIDWSASQSNSEARATGGSRISLRDCPAALKAARKPSLLSQIQSVLGEDAFPVRAILFDKTPDANWKVAWHQDLTIAVEQRHETEGYSGWSEKDGISHVQPPPELLNRMLTARIHFDPCGAENGPLRVIPGSHRNGRLSAAQIQSHRQETPETLCIAGIGDVLFMRPLLLHASSAATLPAHRRVLHIEYAAESLPGGLAWHEQPTATK
jgi:ectoine hydroxylase-related dioxygenase (phytanoyl-CoA dioxygenase family)